MRAHAVLAADADADISELHAADLGPGVLAEITSPSLFASIRYVVVRSLEDLPADAVDPLVEYVGRRRPTSRWCCTTPAVSAGKAVLDKLRKAGAIEVKAEALKKWELPKWVVTEFRHHKTKISESAAAALVDAVGEDLRALAGAADQLSVRCRRRGHRGDGADVLRWPGRGQGLRGR